jgi:HSP20 family protein
MNSIERWNPFAELESMRSNMNRMFDRWFDEGFERAPAMFSPAVDLVEKEGGYELHANLPGFTDKEIDIQIEKDVVTIKAQHEEQKEEKKEGNFLYRERKLGSFYRSMRLPQLIDADKSEARMENGVLVLNLPKAPHPESRKIEVKVK